MQLYVCVCECMHVCFHTFIPIYTYVPCVHVHNYIARIELFYYFKRFLEQPPTTSARPKLFF